MGKKRTVGMTTANKIRQKMTAGDNRGALQLAQREAELTPKDPEILELLRTVMLTVGNGYVQSCATQALSVFLAEADSGRFQDEPWQRQLALWYAQACQPTRALELADRLGDATFRTLVQGTLCDVAIRIRSASHLPAELQSGYKLILESFQKYHLGHEKAAKERLDEIGLSSPFLEWKVLLRGFLAYSDNDNDTARANWSRLHPERLPAKLAAPYRSQVDPTAPKSNISTPADPNSLAHRLRAIQGNFGRSQNLSAAFKSLDSILPLLKAKLPSALPRLANVFYHSLAKYGQPEDMARYRRYFGAPKDDPDFHKLQGQKWEEAGELRESLQHWAIYDGWLSGPPASWPEPLARRARAIVQYRMANLAADLDNNDDPSPFDDFFGFMPGGSRKKARTAPKAKGPDPAIYLRKALELAPDWEKPAVELFLHLSGVNKSDEAESVARAFLSRVPGSVPMLTNFASYLTGQGRSIEALELRRKALATNPLDQLNQTMFASAVISASRRLAIAGKLEDAEQLLAKEDATLFQNLVGQVESLRAAIARKAGRKDEADQLLETALARPHARLATRLSYHANVVLLKCKPADKTAASKALAAALAEQPLPREAGVLHATWLSYSLEGLTYTGQKTQEKKIFDAMIASAKSNAPETDHEFLCESLLIHKNWKILAKLAESLMKVFKTNPVFPVAFVEAELGKNDGRTRPYKLEKHLNAAKRLASASPHERHKQLLPRIEELFSQANPFGSILDRFF